MRLSRHRWTIVAVMLWALALVVTSAVAPIPAEASAQPMGWMLYSVNHPNGCVPLPYDCYVVIVR